MYRGKMRYCCQYTIQYPEKITRKSMKRPLLATVRKSRADCAGFFGSAFSRGSWKKTRPTTIIAQTLRAAIMNTACGGRRECSHPARNGHNVLPMLTIV